MHYLIKSNGVDVAARTDCLKSLGLDIWPIVSQLKLVLVCDASPMGIGWFSLICCQTT